MTVIDMQPVEQPKRRGRPPREVTETRKSQALQIAKKRPFASIRQIAEETGISRTTAAEVLAKYKINKQEVDAYAANQADILMGLQHRITANISDSDIEKASLKDKIVAASICLDKHRLITGQSTSNIASWTHVVSESHRSQVIDNAKVAHSTTECDKVDGSVD